MGAGPLPLDPLSRRRPPPLGFALRHPARVALRLRDDRRSAFADRHLRGLRGIEVGGAAHNDFGLETANVDRTADLGTVYKREELERCGRAMPVDFVLASHVVEHFPDPIRALAEWRRVAREKVLLVVPHRDRTFDRDRPLTPVHELLERHRTAFASPEDRHWSVWDLPSFLALCDAIGAPVLDSLDPDDKTGNGFMVVLDARP